MTKLEMAAIALANEVESNVLSGVPLTTNLILTLNEFRKAQIEQDQSFGADLDAMYEQHLRSIECPVVDLAKLRK